ncbi:Uncharacterized protein At4g19900 [Durusdinium trenchii]|uniref:Uncharacterized protein At4g19900 n=1 Tax=Durusdinium trenchii TaxID=1381693 RepID=A0ABP0S6J0_9DINO
MARAGTPGRGGGSFGLEVCRCRTATLLLGIALAGYLAGTLSSNQFWAWTLQPGEKVATPEDGLKFYVDPSSGSGLEGAAQTGKDDEKNDASDGPGTHGGWTVKQDTGCKLHEDKEWRFAVWLYDEAPPPAHPPCPGETVICGFDDCFARFPKAVSINLRELSENDRLHRYVQMHMYHKIVAGDVFLHHIQSIGQILLVKRYNHACARTLGAPHSSAICFSDLGGFSDYDPSSQQPAIKPLFAAASTGGKRYNTLDYSSRVKFAPVANSGDEMQGFGGVQFFPTVNGFVDSEHGLPNAKGDLVANAWWGSKFAFPPDLDRLNLTMVAMHYSAEGVGVVKLYKAWYRNEYNRLVGAVGARDTGTLKVLRSLGIRTYFSACMTLTIDLGFRAPVFDLSKNKIVVVDVAKTDLPESVVQRAEFFFADVHPVERKKERNGRVSYAFDLLKQYAENAKVVITARIHNALPALAQGVPVIFVRAKNLPGGGGGRTGGLVELFHQYVPGTPWTFDLDNLPPNPGVHKADRYRASFWNYMQRRSSTHARAARLFGWLPLQRLGAGVPSSGEPLQDNFHFIYTTPPHTLTWRVVRAIEMVFYHHPNARVTMHSNTLPAHGTRLDRFAEAGYDFVVEPFDTIEMLRLAKVNPEHKKKFFAGLDNYRKGQFWYSHETDLVRLMVLYTHGGVYLDTDQHVLKPIPKSLSNVFAFENLQNTYANVAALVFDRGSPFIKRAIDKYLNEYAPGCWGCNGPGLITRTFKEPRMKKFASALQRPTFYPYTWETAHKCFEASGPKKDFSKSYTLHLNTKVTSKYKSLVPGSVCEDILQRYCIFCDEVRTWPKGTANVPNLPP